MKTPISDVTAVLLIAHGSRRAKANQDLLDLADRLAAQGDYPIVVASFLELADPDIPGGGDRCVASGASRVLMLPYFLAEGVHLRRDLTAARDELAARYPHVEFRLGSALGPHPLLDRLVVERAQQTEGNPDLSQSPLPQNLPSRRTDLNGPPARPASLDRFFPKD